MNKSIEHEVSMVFIYIDTIIIYDIISINNARTGIEELY